MWAGFLLVAVNVSQSRVLFAFNLGQIRALIASRGVYESGPLQLSEKRQQHIVAMKLMSRGQGFKLQFIQKIKVR